MDQAVDRMIDRPGQVGDAWCPLRQLTTHVSDCPDTYGQPTSYKSAKRREVMGLTVYMLQKSFFHVAKSEMNFFSQMPWSYVHIINDDLSAHLWVFASPVPRSWLPLPVTMPLPQTSGSIQFFTFFVVILWWQFKCQTVIPGSWIYIYALKKIKKCWNSFVVCMFTSFNFFSRQWHQVSNCVACAVYMMSEVFVYRVHPSWPLPWSHHSKVDLPSDLLLSPFYAHPFSSCARFLFQMNPRIAFLLLPSVLAKPPNIIFMWA